MSSVAAPVAVVIVVAAVIGTVCFFQRRRRLKAAKELEERKLKREMSSIKVKAAPLSDNDGLSRKDPELKKEKRESLKPMLDQVKAAIKERESSRDLLAHESATLASVGRRNSNLLNSKSTIDNTSPGGRISHLERQPSSLSPKSQRPSLQATLPRGSIRSSLNTSVGEVGQAVNLPANLTKLNSTIADSQRNLQVVLERRTSLRAGMMSPTSTSDDGGSGRGGGGSNRRVTIGTVSPVEASDTKRGSLQRSNSVMEKSSSPSSIDRRKSNR